MHYYQHIIKKILPNVLLIFLLSFSSLLYGQTINGDKILGKWETAEKDGIFMIYKKNGKYHGKMLYGKSMKNKDGTLKKDTKNPNTKMKSRTWKGGTFLHNFTFEDGEYTGGKVYDFRSGKSYNAILKIRNGLLEVRGYVGFSLFGQTVKWHRIK